MLLSTQKWFSLAERCSSFLQDSCVTAIVIYFFSFVTYPVMRLSYPTAMICLHRNARPRRINSYPHSCQRMFLPKLIYNIINYISSYFQVELPLHINYSLRSLHRRLFFSIIICICAAGADRSILACFLLSFSFFLLCHCSLFFRQCAKLEINQMSEEQ